MANTLIPIEERNLTPDQVELLDRRRRRGQAFLVVAVQTTIISCLLLLWSGQDFTLTPGWVKPIVIWNTITVLIAISCYTIGIRLRRGTNEFFSY
ncbi:hypothetical protein [Granulicella tundricola]|uniref:Uncharacterized protein n=1 Tax=Granulicella tundricola (strain ATCC BAA-1859 / DSM 23138 / MP5ACTX9) TaxID=1198114 RepID=E8WYM5_GRATM|nr:hypothetical protein [Granulicella tundricola]ADW67623.1 hypothetical protein AciX9_0551 [Granulicella tundricola MP5ACTX9]